MKKVIPALSALLLVGCSSAPIHTTAMIPPTFDSLPAASHLAANQSLKFNSVLDYYSTLSPDSRHTSPDFYPSTAPNAHFTHYLKTGRASWYGKKFHGRKTATGERFDMYALTAAHKTLPIPSYAQVTNLENHRSVIVRINDRGPFVGNRLLDLSYAAAKELDMHREGTGTVEIKALSPDQVLAMNKNMGEDARQIEN
jgi:rare lipoprotein A